MRLQLGGKAAINLVLPWQPTALPSAQVTSTTCDPAACATGVPRLTFHIPTKIILPSAFSRNLFVAGDCGISRVLEANSCLQKTRIFGV
jgi:hypothetical protein